MSAKTSTPTLVTAGIHGLDLTCPPTHGSLPFTIEAAQYDTYGKKDLVIRNLNILTPAAGQLLVRVDASSVNPVDWKLQSGQLQYFIRLKLPFTPGIDVAGHVVALGPGVTTFKAGDEVLAFNELTLSGGLAEYALVQANRAVLRLPEVSALDAAALPVAASTALQSLRDYGLIKKFDGSYKGHVLIIGGSGGVGTFGVQLAKLAGAYVVATAGTRNLELVKSLGADEVLDYTTEAGQSYQTAANEKFDVVLVTVDNAPLSKIYKVLKPAGKVICINANAETGSTALMSGINIFSSQKTYVMWCNSSQPDLTFLQELVRDKKLRVVQDMVVPLADVNKAWAKSLEGHAVGKILVNMV